MRIQQLFARLGHTMALRLSAKATPKKAQEEDKHESLAMRLSRERRAFASIYGTHTNVPTETLLKAIFPRTADNFIPVQPSHLTPVQDSSGLNGTIVRGAPQTSSAKITNPLSRYGINDKILQHYQNRGFIGWTTCAVLAQHEVINRACSIPAEDAIAHGYRVVCSSSQHTHNEEHEADESNFLRDIKKFSDRLGMNDICVQLAYKQKVFGVGLALPRVKGANYEKPYNPDGIRKGSYEGFAVVDPYWLTYELDNDSQTDPTSPSFYEPTYYRMPNGKRVHKSWLIRAVNAHVPDVLKPTYYFGGVPLPQMIYERVFCADKIANEAPLLAMTKRLLIADANVEEMIADPSHASKLMKAINYFRDNFSIFFKKPNAQVQQIDTSLGEFNQLIMTQYQLVACIAQMPATKLLKVTPTGFQSTGEYEWKDYAQLLLDIQNNTYMPLLERHYELLMKSEYAERKDLSLSVVFNPIDVPTKEQTATVEARVAQLISTLIQSKVILPEEARTVLRTEDQGLFNGISPQMPETLKKAQDLLDPEKAQQMQQQMQAQQFGGGAVASEGGQEVPAKEPDAQQQQQAEKYSQVFKEAVNQAASAIYQSTSNQVKEVSQEERGDGQAKGTEEQETQAQSPAQSESEAKRTSERSA